MNPTSNSTPQPALLIIADISGYTRYMMANAKTLAHSQTIITELVKSIIEKIKLPFEVARLEGDAIFLFCRKRNGSLPWAEAKQIISTKLLAFFRLFSEKLGELSRSTTCTCRACKHIEHLRLKVVVHSGEVLFHRVLSFVELAGLDVIIAHRLLKNSVAAGQYLLLTAAARQDLEFAEETKFSRGNETYMNIGSIETLVYLPDGQPDATTPSEASFASRFCTSWRLFGKLWFAPFAAQPRQQGHKSSAVSAGRRLGFAVLTLLLTPVYLPVGTIFVLHKALRKTAEPHHRDVGHKHKTDGSCCGGH